MESQDSLIREVNDAMLQDRLRSFGKYVVFFSIFVLVATIGYVWWNNHKIMQYQQNSDKLFNAIELIEAGNYGQAKPLIDELAKKSEDKIAVLAQMWQIKLKFISKKNDEAILIANDLLEKTAGKKALLRYHDWAQIYAKPNVENKTYHLSGLEMQAAKEVAQGNFAQAKLNLQRILNDVNSPPTMRGRAEKILQSFGDEVKDAK
jgi:hypothetical protein